MDRLACVDLPFLPLQILLRREQSWRSCPAAVVESDAPQAFILSVNRIARRLGVLPGMRYAAALGLARELRAAVVSASEIEQCVQEVVGELRNFSPGVEPSEDEPGVFWIDARGLDRLIPSYEEWGRSIQERLQQQDLLATVVVGFSHFGTYAAARFQESGASASSRRGRLQVFGESQDEFTQVQKTPLAQLRIDPATRDTFAKLGVKTVADLLSLPAAGVRQRFGEDLGLLLKLARRSQDIPFAGQKPCLPLRRELLFDDGIDRVDHLLQAVEQELLPLLEQLEESGQVLASLTLDLLFERSEAIQELIRMAEPTLEAGRILGLVFLRFEGLKLAEGVIEMGVEVQGVRATQRQGELFEVRPARSLSAGNRALARVQARFGNGSVVHAVLHDGHLPEATFRWQSCSRIEIPEPPSVRLPSLVRRCYTPALVLAPRARHEPDGWLLGGAEAGSVTRFVGPYILAGGWWARALHREYYYAETSKGAIYWVYYDRSRRRWFLQGVVS